MAGGTWLLVTGRLKPGTMPRSGLGSHVWHTFPHTHTHPPITTTRIECKKWEDNEAIVPAVPIMLQKSPVCPPAGEAREDAGAPVPKCRPISRCSARQVRVA